MAVLRVPDEFPTISDAVAAAASGDTILVARGVYREQVRITTDFIRLIAHEANVVLEGDGALGRAFSIRGAQGARNRVNGNSGTGIALTATARFNSVQENRVADNQENGIEVDGKRNLVLRNRLRRNRPFDLVRNEPQNDLIDNRCSTSNPPGLCE